MTKIVSNDTIKALLGIKGTSRDAEIELWNETATEILGDILGVSEFASHAVVNEKKENEGCEDEIYFDEFPIDISSIVLKDVMGHTITNVFFSQDSRDLRKVNTVDASGVEIVFGYSEFWASYTAGYRTQDVLTVVDFAGLVGKTITIKNAQAVESSYTFSATAGAGKIEAITSNSVTAGKIATAFVGTASGDIVTLPIGYKATLGTVADEITLVSANVPSALKTCIAFLVGGGLAQKEQSKGISEYSLGEKTVKFRSEADKNFFDTAIQTYLRRYKKFRSFSA